MARKWTIGYELNSIADEFVSTVGTQTVQTTTARTGTYAGQTTGLASGARQGVMMQMGTALGNGPYYCRFYLNVATAPTAENRIIALLGGTAFSSAAALYVTVDASRVLRLYSDAGLIGASSAITANAWHRIELHYDKSPAAGAQVGELFIDGSSAVSSSTLTYTNQVNGVVWGGNLNVEAQTTGSWFWDDCAGNDGTGTNQTAFPGNGSVYYLWPNGAGASTQWAIGGSTPQATNWQSVGTTKDKPTPDDGVSFVSSNTLNQLDQYTIEGLPAGVGANDVINAVQLNGRFAGAGASANASVRGRIYSGASFDASTGNQTPASTAWVTDSNSLLPWVTDYGSPAGGTWNKAGLASAQVGIILAATNTNAAQVTALWLVVDITPVAASSVAQRGLLLGVEA